MADDNSETSDESLDVTSERFDPLKALYSTKVLRSLPSAPTYDNISKFESVLKGISGSTKVCITTRHVFMMSGSSLNLCMLKTIREYKSNTNRKTCL